MTDQVLFHIGAAAGASGATCARCQRAPLIHARIPHSWPNAAGETWSGHRIVALCPCTPASDPAQTALATALTDPAGVDLASIAPLAEAWLAPAGSRPDPPTAQDIERETLAWRSGAFNGPAVHLLSRLIDAEPVD